MAQNNRSSKGKGKEKGKRSHDSETQSISLSDYQDYYSSPRAYSKDVLDTFSQNLYQLQGQAYPQNDNYYLDTNDFANYPSHGPLPGPTSPGPFIGNGHDGYTTSTADFTTSRSASNFCGVQSSNASEYSSAFSQGAASSVSSAPPRYNLDNVDSHINRQAATSQRYELPCEFRGCTEVFHGDEEADWIRHTADHLRGTFPSRLRCWFDCDFGMFDAKSPDVGGNTRNNFECRMRHIRDHVLYDGFRPNDRIPDGFLIEHLRKQGIIDEEAYRDWLKPSRVPPGLSNGRSSGSGTGDHGSGTRHHRSRHSYLAVVEEEAGPSRSRDRRYEERSEKKEHRRDSHNRFKPTK